jgi:Protein of unknown function (DUF742)
MTDRRVVPTYALTRGRTRSQGPDLPWETMVTASGAARAGRPRLQFERADIVALCRQPVSVAEVASKLRLPLGVTRVLVSDLYAEGLLSVHLPHFAENGRPDSATLERLLAGLRAWA